MKKGLKDTDTIIPMKLLESFRPIFQQEPDGAREFFMKDGQMPFQDFLKRNLNKSRVSRTKTTSL
jgi:hypothetical protein